MSRQGSTLTFTGKVYQLVDDGKIIASFLDEAIANDFNTRFTSIPRPQVVELDLYGSYGEALFNHWNLRDDIRQAEKDCGQPSGAFEDLEYQMIMILNSTRPDDREDAEQHIKTFSETWNTELTQEEIDQLQEEMEAEANGPATVFEMPTAKLPMEDYPCIAAFGEAIPELGEPNFSNENSASYYYDTFDEAKAKADAHGGTAYYPMFEEPTHWAFWNGPGAMQIYSLRGGEEFNESIGNVILAAVGGEKCIEWSIKEPIPGTINTSPEGKQWNEIIPLPEEFVDMLRDAGFEEVDADYMPGKSKFPGGHPYWATTFDEIQAKLLEPSEAKSEDDQELPQLPKPIDEMTQEEMEDFIYNHPNYNGPGKTDDDGDGDEDDPDLSTDPSQWSFTCEYHDGDGVGVFVRSLEEPDYDQHSEQFIGHLMNPLGFSEMLECEWLLDGFTSDDTDEQQAKVDEITKKLVSLGFVDASSQQPIVQAGVTKTVVVTIQHNNWEDDGGDHDPSVYEVDDSLYQDLVHMSREHASNSYDDVEDLGERLEKCVVTTPKYPMSIDGVFNIWYGS